MYMYIYIYICVCVCVCVCVYVCYAAQRHLHPCPRLRLERPGLGSTAGWKIGDPTPRLLYTLNRHEDANHYMWTCIYYNYKIGHLQNVPKGALECVSLSPLRRLSHHRAA